MRHAPFLLASLFLAAPAAAAPPFQHIVIIIQENRTPDNLFGSTPTFEPGVDIASSGVNSQGQTIPLTAEPLDGCYDISHTHKAFEAMLTQGADQEKVNPAYGCTAPANPQFKYVDNSTGTIQPYFDLATQYGFANRMFQTNQGPSFPAHQFLFGGTSSPGPDTDIFASENMQFGLLQAGCAARNGATGQRVDVINPQGSETAIPPIFPCFEHPTLSDLLDAATPALSWIYYAPLPGSIWTAPDAIAHICQAKSINWARECEGPIWKAHVVHDNSAQILTDTANCNLPAVSWVIPTGEESDHAGINNGSGPQWVASIVNAIGTNAKCANGETYWNNTAILILWDDWGGWYDHIQPFLVNQPPNWGAGYTYGFRVPLLVVSAYTPAGFVNDQIMDFGTVLQFTEHNFGLGFIGAGTTPYNHYADYYAASASRGKLGSFFSLSAPRGFTPVATKMKPADFLRAPRSSVPPDNDD